MLNREQERFYRAEASDIHIGKLVAALSKLGTLFKHSSDPGIIVHNLDCDPAMRERLAAFLKNGCLRDSAEQVKAAEIMGRNYCSPGEAMVRLGESYSVEQLRVLDRIPYSAERLAECCKTHLLMPGFPGVTIAKLYDTSLRPDIWQVDKGGKPKGPESDPLLKGADGYLHKEALELRWYLVRLSTVASTDSYATPAKNLSALAAHEYAPKLVELLYARWVKKYVNIERGAYLTGSTIEGGGVVRFTEQLREAYISIANPTNRHDYGLAASAVRPE